MKSHFLFHQIFLQYPLVATHQVFSFSRQKIPTTFYRSDTQNDTSEIWRTRTSINIKGDAKSHKFKLKWRNRKFSDQIPHPDVTLLSWAPQSPDMNIIENLWTILKQEVAAKNRDVTGFCQSGRTLEDVMMSWRTCATPCPAVFLLWFRGPTKY